MSLLLKLVIGVAAGIVLAMLFAFLKVNYGRNGRGIRLLNAGQPVEAERLFTALIEGKAMKRSLAYRSARMNRAVARIDDGRLEEALDDLTHVRRFVTPSQKVMYALWLFNDAYCRIALGTLDGVDTQIDELQTIEVRPHFARPARLRIALHARRGAFETAARLAHADRVDGFPEKSLRARKTQLLLHAFVLDNLPDDPLRAESATLLAEIRANPAPAPTGMGAQWPALHAFLEREALSEPCAA